MHLILHVFIEIDLWNLTFLAMIHQIPISSATTSQVWYVSPRIHQALHVLPRIH